MTRDEAIAKLKIYRDYLCKMSSVFDVNEVVKPFNMAIESLEEAKKREETWDWCTDCKEYDQENHCCHRFSKRIWESVEELKRERKRGEWIPHPLEKGGMSIDRDVCSICGVQFADAWMFDYCPICGSYMRGNEDERQFMEMDRGMR